MSKRQKVTVLLRYIASTYDPYDQIIRDGLYPGGRKVITFANILQHDVFPLARILQLVLKYGEQEMRRPVEIEFAATLSREHDKPELSIYCRFVLS